MLINVEGGQKAEHTGRWVAGKQQPDNHKDKLEPLTLLHDRNNHWLDGHLQLMQQNKRQQAHT